MAKRVAVITGGNKGIGFAFVRDLCKNYEGDVYLTARDENRGRTAVSILQKEGLSPKFHLLDIACDDSIKSLASFLKSQYGGLDTLVNNEAIAYKMADTAPFSEQAENTIKINFFANLNVCHHLFPLLRPHARVMNIASSAGHLSYIESKEIQKKFLSESLTEEELCDLMTQFVEDAKAGVHKERGWGNCAYIISKIGMTKLTFIQQRKFLQDSRPDIVVDAVSDPGYVDTDMTSHKGPWTPDQGASAPGHLDIWPPIVKSPTGEFVLGRQK